MIQVIHGEIWSENFSELNQLINDFQSCVRFSFCRFNKENLEFNDVRKAAKVKYPTLNTRQVSDAVLQGQTHQNLFITRLENLEIAKTEIETKLKKKKLCDYKRQKLEKRLETTQEKLNNPKLFFGGKQLWEDFQSGKITKDQWLEKRNNQIYSRGDKGRIGNPNIRAVNDAIRITIGNRKWVFYKLFIPNKFKEELKELLKSGIAYQVRLKRKDPTHFEVFISYQQENQLPITGIGFENGVIGVDTNPDRIALANVSVDGNLIETKTLTNNRILYAFTEKRDYDLGCMVKEIITYAKEENKGIVFENLKFDKDKSDGSKSWNRKRSNFVWRKFLGLLEAKCIEHQVQYKKVHPAYTSIIGKYKYRWMHKISIHESAAYVIGRRGLGYNETLSFYKCDPKRVKEEVIKTHAGKYDGKRIHSWVLWKHLNDNIEAVLTGLQVSLADLKEFVGNIWYRGENLRSEIFLLQLLAGSKV